jgi:hypothetical protein
MKRFMDFDMAMEKAHLEWIVLAVHCSCCGTSDDIRGFVDSRLLYLRHGQHLGCVEVDFLIASPHEDPIPMRSRLLRLGVQALCLN